MQGDESQECSEAYREDEREEQALHQDHIREEQELHQADEEVEAALHNAEEQLHRQHVQEEEDLHRSHEREEECDEQGKLVKITVDTVTAEVERGTYTVVQIKNLGGVSLAYNLLEEIGGQLVLLGDDASITITKCEAFHSRVKSGGSS